MTLPRLSPKVLLAAGVAIVVLAGVLGLTSTYAYAGDVPRGTTVLGIDIGARDRAAAVAALEAGLASHAEELAAPVDVTVADATGQLNPADIGLTIDVQATIDRAAAASPGPLSALFGDSPVAPVVTVDPTRLHERLSEIAADAGEAMTMPAITFDGVEPVPVYPEPGLGLDPRRSAEAMTRSWPGLDTGGEQWHAPPVVTIPLVDINPVTSAEEVDRLVADLARPAVAAPVTVTTPDDGSFEIPPEAIAASLLLTADEHGEIIPKISRNGLREAIADQLTQVETEPVDARVVLAGGGPAIEESADGERVDIRALASELLSVLADSGPRSVAAAMTAEEPEVTTERAEDLGITEQVSTFTTHFTGGLSSPRSQNIVRAAELVDGAMVLPGETFSLNGHTGERGYAQGFQDAPVIIGGLLRPGVGGGVSQFTTTLFNASYYAGFEDVEHHPHSYYFDRYPAVIESTIFYPDLDMQFRNNTEYGVLIDTSYTESSITVSMWSTRVWDEITTEWGPRRDITHPERVYVEPGPDCIATDGIDGFTQDAWRVFQRNGEEVSREQFTWRYDAEPETICGEDPNDRGSQ